MPARIGSPDLRVRRHLARQREQLQRLLEVDRRRVGALAAATSASGFSPSPSWTKVPKRPSRRVTVQAGLGILAEHPHAGLAAVRRTRLAVAIAPVPASWRV